jgi:hypothetical protein
LRFGAFGAAAVVDGGSGSALRRARAVGVTGGVASSGVASLAAEVGDSTVRLMAGIGDEVPTRSSPPVPPSAREGLPLMFDPTAEATDKCMRWMIGFTKAAPTAG